MPPQSSPEEPNTNESANDRSEVTNSPTESAASPASLNDAPVANPLPGDQIHPGGSGNNAPPVSQAPTTPPPPPPSASTPPPTTPSTPPPPPVLNNPKPKSRRRLFISLTVVFVILLAGLSYAYFGYYMSASTVWSQSLSNASKGYDNLVSYASKQSTTHYAGLKFDGSLNLVSDGQHFNGSLSGQTYNQASTASLSFDYGAGKVNLNERSVPVAQSSPDIYFQLSGLSGLSSAVGPTYGPILNKVNGQWIQVDHNLIEDLVNQGTTSPKTTPKFTWAAVNSYLQTTESINQKYLFSSNKSTAVLTVLKTYGKTTVDGRSTYHYLVGFNKANLKTYVNSLCQAFYQSSLGSYFSQALGKSSQSSNCQSLYNSVNQVKSSDTFQVWDSISNRVPYKIRLTSNPSSTDNYVDIGFNYSGGSSYPFFIQGQSNDGSSKTTESALITLHTNTNSLNVSLNVTSKGSSNTTFSGTFNFSPSNAPLTVTAPAGSVPLTTELNSLGLSNLLSSLDTSNAQAPTQTSAPTIQF